MRIASILITAAVLVGCDSTQKTSDSNVSMGAVNSTCPFSGRSIAGGPVEDYNGTQVGLCCNGCVDAWNDMPADKKKAYIASQKSESTGD